MRIVGEGLEADRSQETGGEGRFDHVGFLGGISARDEPRAIV